MTDEQRPEDDGAPPITPRRGRYIPEPLQADEDLNPQLVPTQRLSRANWNPRKIDGGRFKNLCESMAADPGFMRLRPILAMLDGTIYAGAHRHLAAEQMGWKTVWAVVEDVDEKTAKERALRDNNQWAEWNDDLLEDMLGDLRKMGSNIELLGFDQKLLDGLLKGEDLPAPGDQTTEETPAMWGVIVTCNSEEEQVELLELLTEQGRQVRPLMS